MKRLLNRGFNFSILPNKMDLTQVLTDYKKFERTIVWHEFWHGKDTEIDYEKPIFQIVKTNMPKNYSVPEGLKIFLSSVKSEILDPKNRNNIQCNLPVDEICALKELIKLQKDREIVIKSCDKGAGIMILDFKQYMQACYDHLTSKTANGTPYYSNVDDLAEERVKTKIRKILKDMLEKNVISKSEFDAMNADDKTPGRFYSNFKIHKPHKHGEPPPVRPIISGAGSITEGIATFVEFFIHKIATTHETYLQDTPDFLRMISRLNKGPKLGTNAILATWDAIGLYTNIIHTEGLSCLQEQLNEQTQQETPSEYIIQLMEVILNQNIFTFHDSLWKQEVGAAMGSKPIPHYANIFMARTMDKGMKNLALKYNEKKYKSLTIIKTFFRWLFFLFLMEQQSNSTNF